MKKKNILAIIILLSILLVIYLLFFFNRIIDTRDYIEVKFNGINGNGTCKAEVNERKLKKDVSKAIKGGYKRGIITLEETSLLHSGDFFQVLILPNKNLKNGDTVKVKVVYDNNKWKKMGFKFRTRNYKKKVSGLKKGKKINPFSGFKLKVHGVAPYAYVLAQELSNNGISFSSTPGTNLNNGDKVILEVDKKTIPKNFFVSETSRTFILKDLDSYVLGEGDLEEKNLKALVFDLSEVLKDESLYNGFAPLVYHSSSISKSGKDTQLKLTNMKINNISLDKNYYIYKSSKKSNEVNQIILPYKVKFSLGDDTNSGYGCFIISSVIKEKNGEIRFKEGLNSKKNIPSTDIYFDKADLKRKILNLEEKYLMEKEKIECICNY